jgi:hypothetical protein
VLDVRAVDHVAVTVPDLDAPVAELASEPRVRVLGEIQRIEPPHPLAGRRWIYLLTAWGLQLELVS